MTRRAGASKAGEAGGSSTRSPRLRGHRQARLSQPNNAASLRPTTCRTVPFGNMVFLVCHDVLSHISYPLRQQGNCSGGGQQQDRTRVWVGAPRMRLGCLELQQTNRTPAPSLTLHLWRPGVPGCALVLMHDGLLARQEALPPVHVVGRQQLEGEKGGRVSQCQCFLCASKPGVSGQGLTWSTSRCCTGISG